MGEAASISTGVAARYATAIFELATEEKALPSLEADIAKLREALESSSDLRDVINSPIYGREETAAAIGAVAQKIGLHKITENTLRLMASKRRLFVLPALLGEVSALIADHKGEVSAEVTSAQALSSTQLAALSSALKASVGKEVTINSIVDETIIGGLVVKVGSKMIDASVRSKLNALQNTMKEVG